MVKCCICGKKIEGYGNNPFPLEINPEKKCCDNCNDTYVLAARLMLIKPEEADRIKKLIEAVKEIDKQ